MPFLLQKFIFAASLWVIAGLIGAWFYRREWSGALNILRGAAVFAVITGVIGLILPKFCWPWGHFTAPTLILLLILTTVYRWKVRAARASAGDNIQHSKSNG